MLTLLERRFRALSFGFRVVTDLADVLGGIERLLAAFAVPDRDDNAWPTFEIWRADSDTYEVAFEGSVCHRADTVETVIEYVVWRASLDAIEGADDFVVLHAGAVACSGQGIILPAPPDAGKTTLSAALTLAGCSYLSDEAALIDPGTSLLHPFPRALFMEAPSLDVVGVAGISDRAAEARLQYHVLPADLRVGSVGEPCPVRLIVFPSYVPGAEIAIEPVSRARSLVALAENSFNFHRLGDAGFHALTRVVGGASCYSLRMGNLDEAVTRVMELAGSAHVE